MTHIRFHDDMRRTLRRLRRELFYFPLRDQREEDLFFTNPLHAAHWLLPAIVGLYGWYGPEEALPHAVISLRESHVPSSALAQAVAGMKSLTDPAAIRSAQQHGHLPPDYQPNEGLKRAAMVPAEFYGAVVEALARWPVNPCRMHRHDSGREFDRLGMWYDGWWKGLSASWDDTFWHDTLFLYGLDATLTSTEWQLNNPLEKL